MANQLFRHLALLAIAAGILTGSAAAEPVAKHVCSRPILVAASPLGRSMVITSDGGVVGSMRDFFTFFSHESGCKFEYINVPRIRAFKMLQAGLVDIVPSATRSPERDETANFVLTSRILPMLISLKSHKVKANSFAQIANGSITLAVVRGYDFGPAYRALLADPHMRGRISEVPDPATVQRMLASGRVDATLMTPVIFADAWEEGGSAEPLELQEIDGMPAIPSGLYFAKGRMTPLDAGLIARAIKTSVISGAQQRIFASYFPAWSLAGLKFLVDDADIEKVSK